MTAAVRVYTIEENEKTLRSIAEKLLREGNIAGILASRLLPHGNTAHDCHTNTITLITPAQSHPPQQHSQYHHTDTTAAIASTQLLTLVSAHPSFRIC